MKKTILVAASVLILTGCSEGGMMDKILAPIKDKMASYIKDYVKENVAIGEEDETTDREKETAMGTMQESPDNRGYDSYGAYDADDYIATDKYVATEVYDSVATAEDYSSDNTAGSQPLSIVVVEDVFDVEEDTEESLYAQDVADNVEVNEESTLHEEEEEEVYQIVETQPEFPGGTQAMKNWLAENIKYPRISRDNNSQGRTFVRFIVDKNGYIQNVTVLRSSGDKYLDDEAVRVVSSMPRWTPGRIGDKSVNTWFTLPVGFKLY